MIAENGFAHTTNKAIAVLAGVDLASINYHFGNREGLYRAVLLEAHRHFMTLEGLEALASAQMSDEEKLRAVFSQVLPLLMDRGSWHGRVLAAAVISGDAIFQSLEVQEVFPKFLIGRQILSEITGLPKDSPELLPCLTSTLSPLLLLFLLGERLPLPLANLVNVSPESLAKAFADFAIAGLKAKREI